MITSSEKWTGETMDDLISRQAAIAYSISGMTREIDGDKWIRVSEVRESLKTMPSAQSDLARDIATIIENEKDMRVILKNAQPERKKGRWLPDNRPGGGFWVCSECNFPSEAFAANVLYKFCPNCGAKMQKGGE